MIIAVEYEMFFREPEQVKQFILEIIEETPENTVFAETYVMTLAYHKSRNSQAYLVVPFFHDGREHGTNNTS